MTLKETLNNLQTDYVILISEDELDIPEGLLSIDDYSIPIFSGGIYALQEIQEVFSKYLVKSVKVEEDTALIVIKESKQDVGQNTI